MFAERVQGRAPIILPPSMIELTNDFIMEGVVSLLLPPSDLLTRWVVEDSSFSEQERASMLDFIAINDGVKAANRPTLLPAFDPNEHEAIREKTAYFGAALATRFQGYIIETVLPLFINGQLDISADEPIIIKRYQDVEPVLEESLHDFVSWVETQLESPEAQQVIGEINGMTYWDKREQIVNELMAKNHYTRKRVELAKERLLRMFSRSLDTVIQDLAVNLKSGMHVALVELAKKDREMIPGPRHLE